MIPSLPLTLAWSVIATKVVPYMMNVPRVEQLAKAATLVESWEISFALTTKPFTTASSDQIMFHELQREGDLNCADVPNSLVPTGIHPISTAPRPAATIDAALIINIFFSCLR